MPTINQLLKKRRTRPKARDRVPALEKSPQKRGVCLKVYTTTPKPSSAASDVYKRQLLSNQNLGENTIVFEIVKLKQ